MKQKNSWIVIHTVEEATFIWVVMDLVNKWWSSHISIDPNQGTFCTFLVPWRLERSLSIEYPMAYLRSFRTVGGWKTAGGTAVAKTCCNDCALKSIWKKCLVLLGIFEEWWWPTIMYSICHMHPRLSHEILHEAFHKVWPSWLTLL